MSKLEQRMAYYIILAIWVHITKDTLFILFFGLTAAFAMAYWRQA